MPVAAKTLKLDDNDPQHEEVCSYVKCVLACFYDDNRAVSMWYVRECMYMYVYE
jgi:hypothetical protein